MKWQAIVIILLFYVLVVPILCTKQRGSLLAETWFGLLLILGGTAFCANSYWHDHVSVWHGGRIGGIVLSRAQMRLVGLFFLAFGILWIYRPIRRRYGKRDDDDDKNAN